MIVDTLRNAARYKSVHPVLSEGLSFLAKTDLLTMPDGRHDIDGDRLYVMVAREQGRARSEARLEAHRAYADIQVLIAGSEEIGWAPFERAGSVVTPHDEGRDIALFAGEPVTWVRMVPGIFAIFFPEDAHAPLVGVGPVRKIVVKVRLA